MVSNSKTKKKNKNKNLKKIYKKNYPNKSYKYFVTNDHL